MSDFNRIKDSLQQLNAQIEQWDFNSLNDEEYEEIQGILEQTILLLTGEEDVYEDEEDIDDSE